jgi:DNA-binding response OmpR family regulator
MSRRKSETRRLELPTGVSAAARPAQFAAQSNAESPLILFISAHPRDHEVLCCIIRDRRLLVHAGTCRKAISFLCTDPVPVVFCERDLPDGTWRDILRHTSELVNPPALIVTSSMADERLWAEVLNLGGFDVLAQPFSEPEVKHVLESALRHQSGVSQRALVASAIGIR